MHPKPNIFQEHVHAVTLECVQLTMSGKEIDDASRNCEELEQVRDILRPVISPYVKLHIEQSKTN